MEKTVDRLANPCYICINRHIETRLIEEKPMINGYMNGGWEGITSDEGNRDISTDEGRRDNTGGGGGFIGGFGDI